MSIIYFCTFLFPAPSFPSPLAVADPGNLGPAQSLLNPTPSVKFYNSIFSDSPQLSSSGLSEIRQTGCCSAAPTPRVFIQKLEAAAADMYAMLDDVKKLSLPCNDTFLVLSHFSLFHTYNTQKQTGCIFLYRDMDHCCERKPWKLLVDI